MYKYEVSAFNFPVIFDFWLEQYRPLIKIIEIKHK